MPARRANPEWLGGRDLFILDLANNHQGSVRHALDVVGACAEAVRAAGVQAAVKFQFRELDTFIHPAYRGADEPPHVKRFLSTRLGAEDWARLAEAVRAAGLRTMATPFDEDSVDLVERLDLDFVKIASCSAADWPLVERVAASGRPVVFSTGGLTLDELDNVVSFSEHRALQAAIMHCVAVYPTPSAALELHQIGFLRRRYPDFPIGWSTHEAPDDTDPVQVAVALGATLFERHVGIAAGEFPLNAYSSTPEQLGKWFAAYRKARAMLGDPGGRHVSSEAEQRALAGLERGVWAAAPLEAGQRIARGDVFFAMPLQAGQMVSGAWRNDLVATRDLAADEAIRPADVRSHADERTHRRVYGAIHQAKALLNTARIRLPDDFRVEYSHHLGWARFDEVGAFLIDVVNREYCKKYIIQIPGQRHPAHYHKRKEETFVVLFGELRATIDGRERVLRPGDQALVLPGVWHDFRTATGVVFEEISTTHHNDDSVYQDPAIQALKREERKTVVDHWGRYQLQEVLGAGG